MRQMNDELLSIQGVSQIGARHCSCSNNAHFVISVLQKLTLVHFDSISRQYSLFFHQLLMSKGEAEILVWPPGDLRLLRTFSIRPLINYGGNTKMSLSSDFSEHQGDIIFSVLGGKLQKSLLQFSYPVMNNEPTRVTEDSSTL